MLRHQPSRAGHTAVHAVEAGGTSVEPRLVRRAVAGIAVSLALGGGLIVLMSVRGAAAGPVIGAVAGGSPGAAARAPAVAPALDPVAAPVAPVAAPTAPTPAVEAAAEPEARDWEHETGITDPAEPVAEPELAIPMRNDEPLDSWYPTLADWAHPVTLTREYVPSRRTRWFGAVRVGVDREVRPECGEGHCGVDLGGKRGTPLVAVAWGTVVRIERSEMGRDGRSGRYVRIQHPDEVYTAYMHMDAIADGLEVGDEVEQGQILGTLGRSGIVIGDAHLHFTLEAVIGNELQYVDPAPFLARARKVPVGDRRVPLPAL